MMELYFEESFLYYLTLEIVILVKRLKRWLQIALIERTNGFEVLLFIQEILAYFTELFNLQAMVLVKDFSKGFL